MRGATDTAPCQGLDITSLQDSVVLMDINKGSESNWTKLMRKSQEQRKFLSHKSVEAGSASWRSIPINLGSYYSLGYKVGAQKRCQTDSQQKWGFLGRSHASAFRFHHLPSSCALHRNGGKPILLALRRSGWCLVPALKSLPGFVHSVRLLPSPWLSPRTFADTKNLLLLPFCHDTEKADHSPQTAVASHSLPKLLPSFPPL